MKKEGIGEDKNGKKHLPNNYLAPNQSIKSIKDIDFPSK